MPALTLLTDLGTAGHSASSVESTLRKRVAGADVVNISHHVACFDVQQAAYLLRSAWGYFPPGSIHIALVDVFYNDAPALVLAAYEGHYFLAPDNGILSLAFGDELQKVWLYRQWQSGITLQAWMEAAASLAADIIQGEDFADSVSPHISIAPPRLIEPRITDKGVAECNVVYIDRFGNVVLNITRQKFTETFGDRPFRIALSRRDVITTVNRHYNEVPAGRVLCRFNAVGFLEIAINRGSAAEKFGLQPPQFRNVSYQVITIEARSSARLPAGRVPLTLA